MTVKLGISLPDMIQARALEHAHTTGTTLSGLIAELERFRQENAVLRMERDFAKK